MKDKKIKIIPAKRNDFGIIQELNQKLFQREWKKFDSILNPKWSFSDDGKRYLRKALFANDFLVLKAVNDDKVVGYLIGKLIAVDSSRHLDKRAILDNMFVQKEYRQLGVGSKLVKEFLKWAKGNKVDNIRVTAFVDNKRAINFYKRQGFKEYNLTLEI